MNKRLIDTARDPDLRLSYQALLRAANRARQVALQTGTSIVISRNGVVEVLDPATETAPLRAQATMPPYIAKR
jgi:nucleotide-binding universal stress UspA family protein